jgi:hypothetical protein
VPNDTLVEVRREWNDGATAMYRLDAVSGWHWHCVGGGMNAWGSRDFPHGYVKCNEAVSGRVSHSCKHGPPPHNIKICILQEGNEAVWDKVIQCAGPRPRSESDAGKNQRDKTERRFRDRGLSGMTIQADRSGCRDARVLVVPDAGGDRQVERHRTRNAPGDQAYRSRFIGA